MCNDSIQTNIVGIAGNTSNAPLELCNDFFPVVYVRLASEESQDIVDNSIFKVFQESDSFVESYKPFIKKMEEYTHLKKEAYYVPYLRIWPSQKGTERIFNLSCIISETPDNCSDQGDLYFEMPTKIKGLEIKNAPEGILKDVYTYSTVNLELSLSADADRTATAIDAVPLVFYVMNNEVKTEVGRIHLSVAPKDVFSEGETTKVIKYFEDGPYKKYKDVCITAVRKGLEKLLNIDLRGAANYKKYSMDDFMEYVDAKGYIIGSPIVIVSKTEKGVNTNPKVIVQTDVEREITDLVRNEVGYHIFTLSLVSCYHTMTLIVDNRKIDGNIPIHIPDQHHMNNMDLSHVNSAMSAFINGYLQQVHQYNSISKLWKITRILLLVLCLSSCGQSSSKQNNADVKITVITDNKRETENIQQTKNDIDSLKFSKVIAAIKDRAFQFSNEHLKCGNDTKIDMRTILGIYFDNIQKFSNNIIYYRTISFDESIVAKPRCSIRQLQFTCDSTALQYIKTFQEVNNNNRKNSIVKIGYRYFISMDANVVYIFASFDEMLDHEIWNLKQNIDTTIIKPNETDMEFNRKNSLNKL